MAYQQCHPQLQYSTGQVQHPGSVVVNPVSSYQPGVHIQNMGAATESRGRSRFAKDSHFRCGVLQIVLGAVAIIFGIVAVSIGAGRGYGGYSYISHYGTGIWCGVIFIIAGALGVVSSKNADTCTIVGCMVMSIMSTLFGVTLMGTAIGMIIHDNDNRVEYHYERGESWTTPVKNVGGRLTIDALILIVAVAEMAVSIIQSSICCRTVCCCDSKPSATVIYIPQQIASPYYFPTTSLVESTSNPPRNVIVPGVPVGTNMTQAVYSNAGAPPGPVHITPVEATDQPPKYADIEKGPPPP